MLKGDGLRVQSEYKTKQEQWDLILKDIVLELKLANSKFPPFNSLHEGYAVMLEEFDEMWEEIRKKEPNTSEIYLEVIQIAAMSVKFLDLLHEKYGQKHGLLSKVWKKENTLR